jgi:prophage regulatory protein
MLSREKNYQFILIRGERTMKPQVDADERLIKIDEVRHICGLSRSSIYASIQKGEFPAQVKLSTKASGWVYSEVMQWITSRIQRRLD